MSIVDEVREILAAAKPANSNCPHCAGELRPVSSPQIGRLLANLEAYRPIGRTWERKPLRIVTSPAPYQRALVGGQQLR